MTFNQVVVEGFEDDFGRDLASALWTLPNGTRVLCCGDESEGYSLYTREEWNAAAGADWCADKHGRVTHLGEYVDSRDPSWIVPPQIRAAAIH